MSLTENPRYRSWNRPWALLMIVVGCGLVPGFCVNLPDVLGWSAGGYGIFANHHGDLAERAARCYREKCKKTPPGPPGCRKNQPVDLDFLYIDQLRLGAAEPDFTDGVSSSKHSWNPRFDPNWEPLIRRAYPSSEFSLNDELIAGAATIAVVEEKGKVEYLKQNLLGGACQDHFAAFAEFYAAIGRVTHYMADAHSPLHPNSFGVRDRRTGALKQDDYHEGIMDPLQNAWILGLWEHSSVAHGYPEWEMGDGANILNVGCPGCGSGERDVNEMARQAAETMDSYTSEGAGTPSGYRGLISDWENRTVNGELIREAWGPERARAAIASIETYLEDVFAGFTPTDPCQQGPCGPQTSAPGGDTPDDSRSFLSAELAEIDAHEVIGAFKRLAVKKRRAEILNWMLWMGWEHARIQGQLSSDRLNAYAATLVRQPDRARYFREWVTSPDVAFLTNGFTLAGSDLLQGRFREPARRLQPSEVDPGGGYPVLFIPTGGLYGLSQSEQFKAGLESYVRLGGTAVTFSQQRGSDFSVLPTPDGQSIRGWGWFEDSSCYQQGTYVDTFHPILASQSQSLVTSAVDGYFDCLCLAARV